MVEWGLKIIMHEYVGPIKALVFFFFSFFAEMSVYFRIFSSSICPSHCLHAWRITDASIDLESLALPVSVRV